MDSRSQELPIEGKIELARRISIAIAVSHAVQSLAHTVISLENASATSKQSKFFYWVGPLIICFLFLGHFVERIFYFFALFAAMAFANRFYERMRIYDELKRFQERLDSLKVTWMSGGHHPDSFNKLISIKKRKPDSSCNPWWDDEDYDKWWCDMHESAENCLRDLYHMEHVSGSYKRLQEFDAKLSKLREEREEAGLKTGSHPV